MSAPMCLAGRWHGCLDTFNGVVLMTLATVPLSAVVVWVLARRRLAAGVPFNVAHAAGNVILALVAGPELRRVLERYERRSRTEVVLA